MKQREAAAGGAPRLYFAYSTILDREAFEEWRRQHGYDFFDPRAGEVAEARGVRLVYDFPSRWWGGRVAGLEDAVDRSVFGRLYEIAAGDWPIVQHKEGVVTQMCQERPVQVLAGGRTVEAVAFTTRPERRSTEGEISTRFVEALVRGARSAGLPESYIAQLQSDAPAPRGTPLRTL